MEANCDYALQHILASFPEVQVPYYAKISDWLSLLTHAEHHGVLGILQQALSNSPHQLPPEVETELRRRGAVQRLIQSHNYESLGEILAALDAAGVGTVALKGPVLGERLFGDPALRVSSDLDLVVAWDLLPTATAVLAGLGYQAEAAPKAQERWQHHVTAYGDGLPLVELHYRFTFNFARIFPAEKFLSRSQPYQTARGRSCRVLATEDEFIYLVLHAAGHLFARLAWLYDIKMFLVAYPGLDWSVIADRVRGYRVQCAYAFASDLLSQRMGIKLSGVANRPWFYTPRAIAARALLSAAEASTADGTREKILGHLFRAILCDNPLTGVRYLGRHLMRVMGRRP